MTKNEIELIEMIKNNNDPEQALLVAIRVIVDFLNHHESTESESSVDSPEYA